MSSDALAPSNKIVLPRRRINCVSFSPCGRYFAAGGDDFIIRVFSTKDFSSPTSLVGHFGSVRQIQFSPTEPGLLASAGDDCSLRVWRGVTGGTPTSTASHSHAEAVSGLRFLPGGAEVASAGLDGKLVISPISGGKNPKILRKESEGLSALELWTPGELLAFGSVKGGLKGWSLGSQREVFRFEHTQKVSVLCLCAPPGTSLLLAAYADRSFRTFDLKTKTVAAETNLLTAPLALVSPSESQIFLAEGGKISERSVPKLGEKRVVAEEKCEFSALAFAQKTRLLVSGDSEGQILVWDFSEGEKMLGATFEVPKIPGKEKAEAGLTYRVEKVDAAIAQLDKQLKLMDAMMNQNESQLSYITSYFGKKGYL